jgi:hypothetical protein
MPFDTVVNGVCFGALRSHNSGEELHEIDSALFACAAMALLVAAGRTRIAKGGMAPRAEARDVASFGAAFRALHLTILQKLRPCDGTQLSRLRLDR